MREMTRGRKRGGAEYEGNNGYGGDRQVWGGEGKREMTEEEFAFNRNASD